MNKFINIAKKSIFNITPYVPGKPIEEVEREYKIKNIIKLASNENPLGPSKLAINAMKKKLKDVNLYPDSSVYYLRNALSKYLKIPENMLMFGNGSNEIEQLIAEAFVNPGEEVLFSELSFVVYPIVTENVSGKAVIVPHRNFRHDIDGFIDRLSNKTKLVFLCNPNNPTGTIITKNEFKKFMSAVNSRTIVVLDEAYFEYARCKDYPDGIRYLKEYPNLIVLRTFSKIYGLAGLRIGYGIADKDIVNLIDRVRPPFNVNLLAQIAAVAALKDKTHMKNTIGINNAGKKFLYAAGIRFQQHLYRPLFNAVRKTPCFFEGHGKPVHVKTRVFFFCRFHKFPDIFRFQYEKQVYRIPRFRPAEKSKEFIHN